MAQASKGGRAGRADEDSSAPRARKSGRAGPGRATATGLGESAGAARASGATRRASKGGRVGGGESAGAARASGATRRASEGGPAGQGESSGSGRGRAATDERRAALLEAAYATIGERGLEGLRTREVAARAGVNISTLHYHFGSKEALVVAVIAHVRDKFIAASARGGGGRGLAAHLAAAWESFREDKELGRVLQELVLRGQRDRAARAAFRALHEFWGAMVEELLREGVARGELRADLDARAGARVVTSFVMGATTQLGVHARAFEFAAVAGELERWLAAPTRRAR